MKRTALLILMLGAPATAMAQFDAADEYYDSEEMAEARRQIMEGNGGTSSYLIMGERLENHFDNGRQSTVWEGQGWYGTDEHRVWLKTEGHYDAEHDATEEAELQVLYSRPIAPFWDLQAGIRHDFKPDPSRDYAVIGLQGMAPYWFEMDMAAFLSDEGNLSTRVEAEYELHLTQRLKLQPRMEVNYAFDDDPAIGVGQGVSKAHAGLRLRYDIRREFSPYLGVSWERSFGDTADMLQRAGEEADGAFAVVGIRFWY